MAEPNNRSGVLQADSNGQDAGAPAPATASSAERKFAGETLDFLREEILPGYIEKLRRIKFLEDESVIKNEALGRAEADVLRLRAEVNGRPTGAELAAANAQVAVLKAEIDGFNTKIAELERELADRPQNPEQVVNLVREGWKKMLDELPQ